MDSKFAPAERAPVDSVMSNRSSLERFPYINDIFCSLSYIFCIFNQQRQVVFANDVMMKSLGVDSIEQVLGKRFGEAFGCVHAHDEKFGCGTSEHCRYCGAIAAILQSHVTRERTTRECRIRRVLDGREVSIELEVTATPFEFEGEHYTIFSLVDITDKKRRGLIERIFFHDILNTAGSLNNIFEVLESVDEHDKQELLDAAASLSQQILDEIITQRMILQAENSSLVVNNLEIDSIDFLETVDKDLRYHDVAKGKQIVIDEKADPIRFVSDPVLLRKIITNMVKNALEASQTGYVVTLTSERIQDQVRLSVHNQSFMPPAVELQVFMRSFSTKGVQRGLGTYSMKILGEQYLGGKVNFSTSATEGTRFYIDLPIQR
ncbi:MAG: HAMP domain-containing histidine kinase [Marinilabiliales bacterium]|nr:HAMP domain-containing histidine kinase [Marinilabiliales bacterium]